MSKPKLDKSKSTPAKTPIFGVLAEYDTPEALIEASKVVRDAGFQHWDTYTPFPVHGIDPAMGIKRTRLPFIVMGAGITGLTTAILLQWWTNGVDYPWIVSGKPFFSIPANVPIMFELTVLFSALTTLGAMLVMNQLPHPSHPLDLKRRFARVTDDKFFLLVEARDPKYDQAEVEALLASTHADAVEPLEDDNHTPAQLPTGLVYSLVVMSVAALVPFALVTYMRAERGREPRIHIIPDMDSQQKYKSQADNDFFPDGRSMREPLEGTVARGMLREDDHLYRGKQGGAWARTFPQQVQINDATMARGKQRYDIFCAPCHGLDGKGNGMVHQRATSPSVNAGADGWVPPADMTDDARSDQPVGQLFNTITNGIASMPPYAAQIEPEDRWAIVLYLRALQRSQNAKLAGLNPPPR